MDTTVRESWLRENSDLHAVSVADALALFQVDPASGLTGAEAERRLELVGPNALKAKKPVPLVKVIIDQFVSPVVALLAAAASVSVIAGKVEESSAIVAVLIINTVIGFTTELRAVRSMEALRAIGAVNTRVRRDGRTKEIPAHLVVPGDIVLLEAGDVLTADLRLIETHNLSANESALTGESEPVSKSSAPAPADAGLGDRKSLVFKGTEIVRGGGAGLVTATGERSELGKISKLVETASAERSPLEKQLDKLAGELIWVTLALALFIGGTGIFLGRDPYLMVEAAIALAVAAIPEGLPIVATMALARGMWRMARRNALIERLATVETLGATTLICTDKTGTLTENRMTLISVITADGAFDIDHARNEFTRRGAIIDVDQAQLLKDALIAGALCNTAELGEDDTADAGDPLEIALLRAARAGGLDRSDKLLQHKRLVAAPFDADVKMMATAHPYDDHVEFYVKGAPEVVIARATALVGPDGVRPLTEELRAEWKMKAENLAAGGLRMLAVARRRGESPDEAPFERLELLALFALLDPPREDVRDAIAACHRAGVRIVMVTGDHAATAKTIAGQVGLVDREASVIEGAELKPPDEMSDEERARILDADIFARVTPAQKLDLVKVYQQAGEVVAMTGDGVNDAPALRKADIGVAMGLRGTQIAREAAAMVLRDDAFSTIVEAIREGRVILRNIQRFVGYLLSCNLSEVLVVSIAIVTGLALPLLPLQILFLNLVTDVFPAFALGAGAGRAGILDRPPRDPSKPILTPSLWRQIIFHGFLITGATLGSMEIASKLLGMEGDAVLTVSFLTLAFAQLWHVFNMRDPRSPIFRNEVTRNPFIWATLALCVGLLMVAIYTPSLSRLLMLSPPSVAQWTLILGMSFLPVVFGQVGKEIARIIFVRGRRNHTISRAMSGG